MHGFRIEGNVGKAGTIMILHVYSDGAWWHWHTPRPKNKTALVLYVYYVYRPCPCMHACQYVAMPMHQRLDGAGEVTQRRRSERWRFPSSSSLPSRPATGCICMLRLDVSPPSNAKLRLAMLLHGHGPRIRTHLITVLRLRFTSSGRSNQRWPSTSAVSFVPSRQLSAEHLLFLRFCRPADYTKYYIILSLLLLQHYKQL